MLAEGNRGVSRKGLSDQLEGKPPLVSVGGRGVRPGSNLCLLPVLPYQTSTSSGLSTLVPPPPWPVGSTIETSGGPDLSDSPSSGGVVAQPRLRKVKVNGVLGCLMPEPGCVYGGFGLQRSWEWSGHVFACRWVFRVGWVGGHWLS